MKPRGDIRSDPAKYEVTIRRCDHPNPVTATDASRPSCVDTRSETNFRRQATRDHTARMPAGVPERRVGGVVLLDDPVSVGDHAGSSVVLAVHVQP
jgi:hypothetical protein